MGLHRKTLRIVTYNIHRCRGLDGRTLPRRAIDVLAGLKADVIALQEVIGAGPNTSGHAEEIGAAPHDEEIGGHHDGLSKR